MKCSSLWSVRHRASSRDAADAHLSAGYRAPRERRCLWAALVQQAQTYLSCHLPSCLPWFSVILSHDTAPSLLSMESPIDLAFSSSHISVVSKSRSYISLTRETTAVFSTRTVMSWSQTGLSRRETGEASACVFLDVETQHHQLPVTTVSPW